MYSFLLFLFVVNSIVIVLSILMQSDKTGLSGSSAFGGAEAMSSAFGGRETASFLHKLTSILTTVFFVLAIVIGLMSKGEFSDSKNVDKSLILEKASGEPASTLPTLDGKMPTLPKKDKVEAEKAKETKETKETEKSN